MFTVAVLGYGGRGKIYADNFHYLGVKITAVCDWSKERRDIAEKEYGCTTFADSKEFFESGKQADALIIATLDDQHFEPTITALKMGYDIILEKPISFNEEECKIIEKTAKEYNRQVVVCHVLRYAPFFTRIKDLIDSGKFGKVLQINLTENIGYYHFAHSYVRGPWRNTKISAPVILAKSCHDLDILVWLLNDECKSVNSYGKLSFFTKDNAPNDSANNCYKCKYKDSCEYSAFKIYLNEGYEKIAALARHGRLGKTEEEIVSSLSNDDNNYGKCVFKCDNDVYDHQVVNLEFKNGAICQFGLTAFSQNLERTIRVYCEKGEIYGSSDKGKLHYTLFGDPEVKTEIIKFENDIYASHGGGDMGMVKAFTTNYGKGKMSSEISQSMQSHYIGFAVQESSEKNGKIIYMDER